MWQDDQLHTQKTAELLAEAGANPYLAHAIMTHNSDMNHDLPKPELKMEKVLFECDEVSGLIQAAAHMRPSGSVMDMPLKSLKKKFKDKRFAARLRPRDVMRLGAEYNGLEVNDALNEVLEAMKAIAPVGDIYAKGAEDEKDEKDEGSEAPAEAPAEAKQGVTVEPIAEGVTFDVFSQSDMRVVHIKDCVAVPKSKKLLQFTLDDGTGTDRTILLRHPRLLRARGPHRQERGRDSQHPAAQDDGYRVVRHAAFRHPRGGRPGAPEPADGRPVHPRGLQALLGVTAASRPRT
jgi:lysyl-tRNA synthetase, class II